MQAEQQRPWQLHVHAKTSNFHFRLKASKFLPAASNFFQFSIRLKLSPLLLKVKCKPKASICWRPKSSVSKFRQILEKLRNRRRNSNHPAIASWRLPRWFANEGSASGNSTVVGNLCLLWQWISEKDKIGIIFLGSVVFPYLASILKILLGRKISNLLAFLIVIIVSCAIVLHLF